MKNLPVALAFIVLHGITAFAQDPAPPVADRHASLEDEAAKADLLWPVDLVKYCNAYPLLIGQAQDLLSKQSPDTLPLVEKLVTTFVAKTELKSRPLSREDSGVLLTAQTKAMRSLLAGKSRLFASGEDRIRYSRLALSLLARLKEHLPPDFKPLPVYANVAPPIASGEMMMSGMDPESIKDPVAKAAYLAAIAENVRNNAYNIHEGNLRNSSRENVYNLRFCLEFFLETTVKKFPATTAQADEISLAMKALDVGSIR